MRRSSIKTLFAIAITAIFIVAAVVAEAKIVSSGKIEKQKSEGGWNQIVFIWHESDDGSGYLWTTWIESDMPGKDFGGKGHFIPPKEAHGKINNQFGNSLQDQCKITPIPTDRVYESIAFPDIIKAFEPIYETEVVTTDNTLGLRLYLKDAKNPDNTDQVISNIPAVITLVEVETGKKILDNEAVIIGDAIKTFDLANKVNNKSMYIVSFKVAGVLDSEVAFFFVNSGEVQRK